MKSKPVLLLADDDADDKEFFEETLRKVDLNAVLVYAADGTRATRYLEACAKEDLPCAVILDYNMPNMNGPQVLDWMGAQQRFAGIAKFVWSTAAQKEYIDTCLKKGALEYFVKPNDHRGLVLVVTKIIQACPAWENTK